MINPKIIQILQENYDLNPSRISEDANLIIFNSFTIDLGAGRQNDNSLTGIFELYIGNFSFYGDIDFSNDDVVVSNITSEPISINDLLTIDANEIPDEKVFKLLGFSKAELKLF